MKMFDACSSTHHRRKGRATAFWCGLVALIAGPAVLLGATSAGAQGPGSVSGVSVGLSSAAAGATEVDYTAAFTTSSTGALDSSNGTITLSTSGSTSFASDCSYTVTDVTTGKSGLGVCPTASSSSAVTITTGGISVGAGDTVHVLAPEVANAPSTGSQSFSVSTSSDLASSTTFSLVAANPVSGVSVSLSKTGAGVQAKYKVTFTTSVTGALDGTFGQIELTGPKGTKFASSCSYTVIDHTTHLKAYFLGVRVGAGDEVTVKTPLARNSKKVGSQTLSVWTSSDLVATGSFTLT
jgi:hypothetical protein